MELGEYISILDADDLYLPERIERGVAMFRENKKAGLVHSNVIGLDEAGEPLSVTQAEKENKENNVKNLSGDIFKNLLIRKTHISCPTVMFKRECVDRVGMFDEKLTRLGCEDRDLWLRISKQYEVAYINKPLACYRNRCASMSKNTEKMSTARYYIIEKNCPGFSSAPFLKSQAYSSVHNELAYSYIAENRPSVARRECVKSIIHYPFGIKPYKMFLRSFVNKRKDLTAKTAIGV